MKHHFSPSRRRSLGLAGALLLGAGLLFAVPAEAQDYKVIYGHTGEVTDPPQTVSVDTASAEAVVTVSGRRTGFDITLVFEDVENNTSVGFDDASEGQDRRDVAAAVWAYINDDVLDHDGEIIVIFEESLTNTSSGTLPLATAGTWFDQSVNGITRPGSLRRIRDDEPLPGSLDGDIFATFNFGYDFYAGTGTPASGEFDLFSVMLHEMGHGLGFAAMIDNDEGDAPGPNDTRFAFTENLFTNDDDALINASNGAFAVNPDWLVGDPAGVYFRGSAVVAETSSSGEQVHTPDPYQAGTSISHWTSPAASGMELASMLPSFPPGSAGVRREFIPVEFATLEDIGWTIRIVETNVDSWMLH